jgi:hypothetical protein
MSTECIDPEIWSGLERAGATVGIRRGDADDPLAGAVRITAADTSAVDVIVGRAAWQREALHRATVQIIEGAAQLLASAERTKLVAAVEAALSLLPQDARGLWARIVEAR